jgi:hypothetical protein
MHDDISDANLQIILPFFQNHKGLHARTAATLDSLTTFLKAVYYVIRYGIASFARKLW